MSTGGSNGPANAAPATATLPDGEAADPDASRPSGRHAAVARLPHPGDRKSWTRRLGFLMLVRVVVFTFILGGTVAVNLAYGTPERLGGPFVTFLFIFIAGLYTLNIVYAVLLRVMQRLALLTSVQLGCDLVVAAVLMNFTGGADSAYVLLFLLSPIGAAITLGRRAAVLTGLMGTALLAVTLGLGYARLLPLLPGQARLPWDVSQGSIITTVVVNGVAMLGVAFLSGYLSEQLRTAAETMEEQQARIYDLAALNADIIRCLTTGLITVGEEGRIILANATAEEILGIPRGEARWKHLEDLAPALAELVRGSTTGSARAELNVAPASGGPIRLVEVAVSPLNDHHDVVRGRILNLRDLTEQRRMERRVKQNEHLAALGRISAGIAHEIRNPLGSISTSLEMVRASDALGAEDGQLMDIALEEIERCNRLITDLLEYARPRKPDMRLVDLGARIHELADSIAVLRTGERLATVRVAEATAGLWVRADTDQLRAVLWNLVRNAWEAGERREVTLRVHTHEGDQVALDVADHGAGIPMADLPHLFEPFFTTKDEGTGLGLAAVHHIIHEHDGTVEVKSREGRGSRFRILLPRAAAPDESDVTS